MSDTLYPHQQRAVDWIVGNEPRVALFDDMGLGKTITAIRAADTLGCSRVLVLAPAVVAANWTREIEKWSPGAVVDRVENGRHRVNPHATHVVCTHGLLLRDAVARQLAVPWDLLIVDEAHFFRTPTAQRTQRLYGLGMKGLIEFAGRVLLLTGTPMPNHAGELWSMTAALWPQRLPNDTGLGTMTHAQFLSEFCVQRPTPYGLKVVGNRRAALPALRALLHGVTMRRKVDDVLDLPDIRYELVTVEAQLGSSSELLREVEDADRAFAAITGDADALFDLLDELRDDLEFAAFRRACGLLKAPAVCELLASELSYDALAKVVVFAHHTDVVAALAGGLYDFGVRTITGSTSVADRDAAVQAFQNDPEVRVIVCNIVAGGVGVTLTAAHEVVFAEMSPVPGENVQAAYRCRRIGQTKKVRVRCMALAGSVDGPITDTLRNKTRMIREVLDE